MRLLVAMMVVLALAAPARAADTWSDPFPGVRRLHRVTGNQNINVLVVDLCAPGVSVRATGSGERKRTVGSFGALVGAQAAVNGDFFSFETYGTNGLSMSGGQQWPGTSDHGYVAPLAFGARRAALLPHELVAGPEPWMQEIVSGHPTLLADGQVRGNNGDPLCTARHPRTAAGLSADERTLFLVVIDGRATGRIGMTCDEMIALFQELGAADAVNLDGGGSSTMWLAGAGAVNYPSDGQQRVVANHLAIHATGSGPAPMCSNRAPRGWLDAAECDAIVGWAQDEDSAEAPIDVHVYFDGPPGADGARAVAVRADMARDDLCQAIGSCAHGFTLAVPPALRDGKPHEVRAYGIDSEGGENPELAGGVKTVTCAPPAPPLGVAQGRLRHVTSAEALGAWGFGFLDVATLADDVVAGYTAAEAWPEAPMLVRAAGEDAVYVVDGGKRRHVVSPESMAAWRLSFASVVEVTAAELAAWAEGPPLPEAPFLLKGTGPAVYLLDAVEIVGPGGGGGGGGAGEDGEEWTVGGEMGCGVAGRSRGGWGAGLLLLLGLLLLRRR